MKKIKFGIRSKLHNTSICIRLGEYDDAEKAIDEIEESIFSLGQNMRKEMEGRFIHKSIKLSEKRGYNVPFVIGQRKRLGKLYQVSIIVTEVEKHKEVEK
ncbi:MAG: hypothetical protein LBP37_04100 [Spirochaetaceae bacterium]|jgi:hypothetical protein|nr:hypothetical protein [Spirochaetaceae bacterium]